MLEAREFSEASKTLQIPVPSTVRMTIRQGKKRNRSEQTWFRHDSLQLKGKVKQQIVRVAGFRGQNFYGVCVADGSIISDGTCYFSDVSGLVDVWIVAENASTDSFICYPKQYAVVDTAVHEPDPRLTSAFEKWLQVDKLADGLFQPPRPFKVGQHEYVKNRSSKRRLYSTANCKCFAVDHK